MEVALTVEQPVRDVKLPTSDIPSRPITLDDSVLTGSQIAEYAPKTFASEAGVFHGSRLSISWKIMNNGLNIELSPLELDARRLPESGSRVVLASPFKLVPYCFAISEADNAFVLDFITAVGTLYTVLIPQTWLLTATSGNKEEPATNISRPYSFDLIAPKLLRAVNAKTLLVALEDGSLVRLDRGSPLEPLEHLFLEDAASPKVTRAFTSFFKFGGDKVPGHPSLSIDTPVSIEIVQGKFVVTYSVDNTARLWSLATNSCLEHIKCSDRNEAPLRLRSAAYVATKGSHIAIAFPNEIRMYKLNDTDEKLSHLFSVEYSNQDLRTWFLTSLNVLDDGKLLVAFKLNMSGRVYIVTANKWTLISTYDYMHLLDLPTNASVDAIKQRVVQSRAPTVALALAQISPQFQSPETEGDSIDDAITKVVVSTVEAVPADQQANALRTQWLRLDTLCREIEAQGSELLTIAPALSTVNSVFFWTLRVSELSLLSTDIHTNAEQEEKSENEALEIAQDLLSSVPKNILEQICRTLLSPALIMERIDVVCDLLRKYLDQIKLNDIGRVYHDKVSEAIRNYIQNFGPNAQSSNNAEKTSVMPLTELSKLGMDAVSRLVRDYAAEQASRFEMLSSLAVIALVEGWLSDDGNSDVLRSTIACLRRFKIISDLGDNLKLGITSVQLENFGLVLARQLSENSDEISLLSTLLPPSVTHLTKSHLADFERVAEHCEPSAQLSILRSFAALAGGEEAVGIELAQQVSLSLQWPQAYGDAPKTQAAWFFEVAKYAYSVNAMHAALWLGQYAESLSSYDDPISEPLLNFLFDIAISLGDISVAYTALTRRFRNLVDRDEAEVQQWLERLITAAAHKSSEDARMLVISHPFVGFSATLQKLLNSTNSFAAIPSYKLLYAWHVEHENFIGAAQTIYTHLISESGIDPVRKAELYTVCLNALAVASSDTNWLAAGERIVTYEDIKLEQKALIADMASQI